MIINSYFNNKENSIITQNFYVETIYSYKCICSKETYGFQYYLDLPLKIPNNKNNLDMIDLLELFFSEEEVISENICSSCLSDCARKKTIRITKLPKILILSIIRFNELDNSKNLCEINFDNILDIENFIDFCICKDNETLYDLYGILCHNGSLNFGHYYSSVKIEGLNLWFNFSDNKYDIIELNNLNKQDIYSLFYLQK